MCTIVDTPQLRIGATANDKGYRHASGSERKLSDSSGYSHCM
jgi:hypothetical protein